MLRQARLDSPGTLHHVMIRGIERRRIVDDEQDRNEFVRRLGSLAEETRTPIYAWALTTIVRGLVEDYGLPIAEIARQVDISTSGVSNIVTRSVRYHFRDPPDFNEGDH